MPVGDRIKTYYVEPPIRAVIQCKKCCEILKNCQKQEICDKCNNLKHGVDSCGPIVQCKNCPENHSSYDRKCNKYRSEKDNMIAAEMLKHGITSKKGKLFKIKNGFNNQNGKEEFAKACSFGSEIESIKQTVIGYKTEHDKTVKDNSGLLSEVAALLKENKSAISSIEDRSNRKFQASYEILSDETNAKLNVLSDATNNRLNNIEKTLCSMANQKFEAQPPIHFIRKCEFTQVGNGGGQSQPMFLARILDAVNDNESMS